MACVKKDFFPMKGSSIPVELNEYAAYYNLERHSDCIIVLEILHAPDYFHIR